MSFHLPVRTAGCSNLLTSYVAAFVHVDQDGGVLAAYLRLPVPYEARLYPVNPIAHTGDTPKSALIATVERIVEITSIDNRQSRWFERGRRPQAVHAFRSPVQRDPDGRTTDMLEANPRLRDRRLILAIFS